MQKYIWLVPLLPLIGAAINGLLGRKFRFSEKLIGGIAVGSVALAFLITLPQFTPTVSVVNHRMAQALSDQSGRF